jgi:hypothetical protein
MLATAGFRLYPKDPGEHPAQAALDPAGLLGTLTGEPYNLYCVQGKPYPRFTDLRRMRTAAGSAAAG